MKKLAKAIGITLALFGVGAAVVGVILAGIFLLDSWGGSAVVLPAFGLAIFSMFVAAVWASLA